MHQESLPPIAPPPGHHAKSLAIALVTSAVFLLAAIGICVWLLVKPAGTLTLHTPINDGSDKVKKVSFVDPANMPASYSKREQDTPTTQAAFYTDAGAGCSFSTSVVPATRPPAQIAQSVLDTAKAASTYGISVVASTTGPDYKIKDADGQHTYVFPSWQLEQKVDIQGVPYQAQRKIIAYKQFGNSVATIESTCRYDAWDAKKDQLQVVANAFVVKTEK